MRLTAANIVESIKKLNRNVAYGYINPKNPGKILIERIDGPEGPIIIKRYNPAQGQKRSDAKLASISTEMIWRIANAFIEDYPINFDRILGASYNTRSALEALLAHAAEFYTCYPGRIETIRASSKIKKGHKHLMWCPNDPHEYGVTALKSSSITISEIPNVEAVYDGLALPVREGASNLPQDVLRRHAQIQIALILIGEQLGFRTSVAQNDKSITYKDEKIGEMKSVVKRLQDEKMLASYQEAIKIAQLIDCIWFKNSKLLPAVLEIEHTTGVTSGLTRMKKLYDLIPQYNTRYVIVAADEDRKKVVTEINQPQFKPLNAKFFPYSAVEELYSLCQRRKIQGVSEEFLDCFMESVSQN